MKYKLKPCPFCGSTTAPTIMTRDEAAWHCDPVDYDGEIPMVVCCAARKGGCGASTGFCNDDEEDFGRQAAEAWNKRAPGWIPCSERLPEDGREVLIITQKGKAVRLVRYSKDCDAFDIIGGLGSIGTSSVAHWMPKPEPPEEVQA